MKILLGLSGGLDSTYAAHLLKKEGNEVVGAAVVMHEYTDLSAAREAADAVGIPLVVIDRRERFEQTVVSRFLADYARGRTPNPCVECNPQIKFAALCDYAKDHGFDRVATGHYASVGCEKGRYFIRCDAESGKDQSYVLWRLRQEQLSLLHLPLAGKKKRAIREEAAALGYRAAESKDSQEICFIPDHDYVAYLERKLGRSFPAGDFVDAEGRTIGRHQGIVRYTVGQRKGLGAFGQPMFVKSIDPSKNTVTLVPSGGEYEERLSVEELNFMKLPPQTEGEMTALCKVRYAAPPVPCHIVFEAGKASVSFDTPVRAVTPGQSAVFYDGNDLLFGGIIE